MKHETFKISQKYRASWFRLHASGFTMIEMIIVIGIILITLPVIFGLFFVNFQAQSKVFILQEVKRNGDYSLNVMESLIKNRVHSIYSDQAMTSEVCSTKNSSGTQSSHPGPIYFKDKDGKLLYFTLSSGRIASYSAAVSYNLTNSKVKASILTVKCSRTQTFSPPLVSVSFQIDQAQGARYEEIASLYYQTKIKLRNY